MALGVGVTHDSEPPTNAERLTSVAKTIRCPYCSGESVAESDAAVSQEIRLDIAKRIQAGQTDDQIRSALADQYGDFVLLTPAATGVTSIVWILPVVVLFVAVAGLASAFRRWQREERRCTPPPPIASWSAGRWPDRRPVRAHPAGRRLDRRRPEMGSGR